MKFLKGLNFKSKSKARSDDGARSDISRNLLYYQAPPGRDVTKRLPPPILEKIFGYVCPHTQDNTYESCEQSAVEDACMLCDLRDLAHCARASRRWRKLAGNVLYHSIRLDSVHYCEREDYLAENRKRGSFFDRNADPEDTAQQRLKLLCRTLRDDRNGFAPIVCYLKIPYMTRETCKADLARTIAVLPNLRYVDLPDGFYTDEPSCYALNEEIHGRCPQIRKMTYNHGAEQSFGLLARTMIWENLEVLELCKLDVDVSIIRYVLGSLPSLRALKIKDMFHNDNLLTRTPDLPHFPALTELLIESIPNISVRGLIDYLSRLDVQAEIKTLSVTDSGIGPEHLYEILSYASNISNVSIVEAVRSPFPLSPPKPLLVSRSLKTLHYEITAKFTANQYNDPTSSYYSYLTSSLLASGLPNLKELYVRDPDFADSLLVFVPPRPAFAFDGGGRQSSSNNPFAGSAPGFSSHLNGNGGLQRQLEVYTKGIEEMEWNFSRVEPAQENGRRGSMTPLRPVSAYGLATSGGQMSQSWTGNFGGRGEVRKSVVVGNGFGGFLAVPADDFGRPGSSKGRPGSSAGEKRGSRYDMWR